MEIFADREKGFTVDGPDNDGDFEIEGSCYCGNDVITFITPAAIEAIKAAQLKAESAEKSDNKQSESLLCDKKKCIRLNSGGCNTCIRAGIVARDNFKQA